MEYPLYTNKDAHGQPLRPFPAQWQNNVRKAFDQLSGICEGILADGVVNQAEADFFHNWLNERADLRAEWPFSDVLRRVERVYADGTVSPEELLELKEIMLSITGQDASPKEAPQALATTLPLNEILPSSLPLENKQFVLTGKFAIGTRAVVGKLLNAKGGVVTDGGPTKTTDYLVIGIFASRDWIHTNYGRKIERAVALREEHNRLIIISEAHLKPFLL